MPIGTKVMWANKAGLWFPAVVVGSSEGKVKVKLYNDVFREASPGLISMATAWDLKTKHFPIA